jgi:hypothetical protein
MKFKQSMSYISVAALMDIDFSLMSDFMLQ